MEKSIENIIIEAKNEALEDAAKIAYSWAFQGDWDADACIGIAEEIRQQKKDLKMSEMQKSIEKVKTEMKTWQMEYYNPYPNIRIRFTVQAETFEEAVMKGDRAISSLIRSGTYVA